MFVSANAQDLPSDPDDMFDIEIIDDSLDLMLDDSLDLMLDDSLDLMLDDSLDLMLDDSLDLMLDDSLDLMLDDSLDLMLDDSLDLEDTTWLADIYDEPLPWTLSSGIMLRNRQVQNGVNLSGSQGIMSIGTEVSHIGGFLAGIDIARRVGDQPGPQGWNARIGYQYSASDWLDLGVQFTRFGYPTDSINPVAGIPNMFTLNATAMSSSFMIDLSYDRMFGAETETVNYLALTLMGMFQWGDFRFSPIASIVGTRYTIATRRLLIFRPGKLQTISGIAMTSLGFSMSYDLSDQWSLTASPMVLYTPQKDFSMQDVQTTIMFGIRHILEF